MDFFAILFVSSLLLAIFYYYFKNPSVIGAAGERRLNAALLRGLDEDRYFIQHDLILPTKRGTTQIDHVVVSRCGLFVIETKNMSGWIFGSGDQARWTQVMRRHKSTFQNPLRQNYGHVKAFQELLDLPADRVHNLVAFVGSAEPKTAMPPNVFWSRYELISHIASHHTEWFTDAQARALAQKLRASAIEPNRETRRAHVQRLHSKVEGPENDPLSCPKCGSKMNRRINRKTGEAFLGCTRYPKCRGTRQIDQATR